MLKMKKMKVGDVDSEKQVTSATLDEAMRLTGFGMYNIGSILLSGLILMGMIMETLGLSYVMPAAQCDLKLNLQNKGWLGAIPFIAIIVTSHFWGWLGDTRGRRSTMLISMSVSVILSTLSSFSPNLPTFAVMRFIASVFTSGPCGVVFAYLGEFNNSNHRDKIMAFGASFVGIGTVVLPGVAWLILPLDFSLPISFLGIEYRSWRLLVVACAVPYMIGYFCMLWAPETPKYLSANGQSEECIAVLKRMYAVNKCCSSDSYPIKSLMDETTNSKADDGKSNAFMTIMKSMKEQTVPLFKRPLLGWTCLSCFVQFGVLAATNGFYIWFPSILDALANDEGANTKICDVLGHREMVTEKVCDDSIKMIYERAIYVGLVFCSTYVIVGGFVDLVGKKLLLVFILGVTGACGVAAHLVRSQQAAVGMFAVFQMSGACIGLMTAVVVELFPTKLRAMAVSLALMMGRVGSMLGSSIIGILLETNCGVTFYLFGGLLIVCSLLCLTLPGKGEASTKKEVAPAIPPPDSQPE